MRFKLIDAAKNEFPVHRLCNVLDVSESGYFAWKIRAPSQRPLSDIVVLAHIRPQFKLSHETYGSPRMHVELREDDVHVGRHRVARLMRDNGMSASQKRRYKKTTDSDHGGNSIQDYQERTGVANQFPNPRSSRIGPWPIHRRLL